MTKRRHFGTIRKMPSGRYRVSWRDPVSGRERYAERTFRYRTDATTFLAHLQVGIDRGEYSDPMHARQTFRSWEQQWWPTIEPTLRPSTRARDRRVLDLYILPEFGDRPLGKIEQPHIAAWVAALSGRGLAPATVRKAYQIFAKAMRASVDARRLATSPCARIPLPPVEHHEMHFLTATEVARLADAIHPRYRALVLLAAYGGLRMGELAGLKRTRVDFALGRVQIVENLVEVEGRIHVGAPKTRAGRRTVTLPKLVVEALAAHMTTWSSEEYVFTSPDGGPLRPTAWRPRFWLPAVAAAGVAPLRPHDLRHTAVSLWIAHGANPKQVAARAGHASASFTLDRYGHLFDDHDDVLLAALDSRIRQAETAGTSMTRPRKTSI